MNLNKASDYEKFRKDESEFHRVKYEKIFKVIKKDSNWKVLELGCGTGTYTRFLADDFKSVTAIDIDKEFLNYASAKVHGVNFVHSSVLDIKTRSSSFDFVLGVSILHHLKRSDYLSLFRGVYRVLRKGGYFALCEPNKLNLLTVGFQKTAGEKCISMYEIEKLASYGGFRILFNRGVLFRSNGNFILPLEDFIERVGLGVTLCSIMKKI